MGEYRSKSYSDGRMEIERYETNKNNYINVWENPDTNTANNNNNGVVGGVGVGFQDLRCYSASYATQSSAKEGTSKPKSGNGSKPVWCFGDPELQRKRRVASYKSYSVEGKLKRSLSKSFRWIKDRCNNMVHGS